ncbi:MAG: nucleoside deaminase [Chloroflexota bacterium]|jgi:tRNA(Arg) A34 adenosine deaminase TadA
MDEVILSLMRVAIAVACRARENGNHPFGALLVDEVGNILLEAENTVVTGRGGAGRDCTGHAETNLMRMASRQFEPEFLARCTLYTSTEPCPMCSGAIFWGNVRRVVYGLSEEGLYAMIGADDEEALYLPCRDVFGKGRKHIEVIGPLLEDEARQVHEGFWN